MKRGQIKVMENKMEEHGKKLKDIFDDQLDVVVVAEVGRRIKWNQR